MEACNLIARARHQQTHFDSVSQQGVGCGLHTWCANLDLRWGQDEWGGHGMVMAWKKWNWEWHHGTVEKARVRPEVGEQGSWK